jgi:hypothetical protein
MAVDLRAFLAAALNIFRAGFPAAPILWRLKPPSSAEVRAARYCRSRSTYSQVSPLLLKLPTPDIGPDAHPRACRGCAADGLDRPLLNRRVYR